MHLHRFDLAKAVPLGSGQMPCTRQAATPLAPTLRAVSFEADRAAQVLPDPGIAVVPIVAAHGAEVPRGKVVTHGGSPRPLSEEHVFIHHLTRPAI